MSGIIKEADPQGAAVFKASINRATLPTIASTSTVPSGKTWVAHGVCKLVEASAFSTSTVSINSVDAVHAILVGGVEGGADSGTDGGVGCACTGAPYGGRCSYCARYCAHYCARYCGLVGYGYCFGYGYGFGFGYGYGTARGFSSDCVAIGVNGSTSWTQVVPSGFTVTTWLYYNEYLS